MIPAPALQPLRALHDCGCIRIRFSHDGYLDLLDEGLALVVRFGDDGGTLDLGLSEQGRRVAAETFKPMTPRRG